MQHGCGWKGVWRAAVIVAIVAMWLIVPVAQASSSFDPAAVEFFEKQVRPLLVEQCYKCHGGTVGKKPKGNLVLTSRAAILKGGDTGPAAVAGNSAKSLIVEAVRYLNTDVQMPPDQRLTDAQINVIEKWVALGMPWPDDDQRKLAVASAAGNATKYEFSEAQRKFWAFQPVKVTPPAPVKDAQWAKGDLDRYILNGLEEKNLRPAHQADKRVLIRRATYDLTGLPPTPAEIDSFLADQSPDAFAKVVDRLLASPAYGERWGRHWLDLVRYCDSRDARDLNMPYDSTEIWRYRDYVVRAFNNDLPYDQFIKDQIAGDLIPSKTPGTVNADGIVATGMLCIGSWGGGDADTKKMYCDMVDDQVNVVSRVFMGLTVGCARCHDHKFDPIPTADYYGLAGIFFSTTIATPQISPPWVHVPLATPAQIDASNQYAAKMAEREKAIKAFADAAFAAVPKHYASHTGEYLLAAYDYEHRPTEQLGLSPGQFATIHKLRPDALSQWLEYLRGDVIDYRLLAKGTADADGRKGVIAFRNETPEPVALINTTSEDMAVPGMLPAKSVAIHPGPQDPIAVAWRSPMAGSLKITGLVAHAHPACGDGVAWSLQLCAPNPEQLAAGDLPLGQRSTLARSAAVHVGDVLRLVVSPKSNHSCDLTDVALRIEEQGGSHRVWDLGKDLTTGPKSNPHADAYGNAEVWSFLDLQPGATLRRADKRPESALAGWFAAAKDHPSREVLEKAAEAVQQAVDAMAARPADNATAAGRLYQDVISDQGPFRLTKRDDESLLPAEAQSQMKAMRSELAEMKQHAPPPIEIAMAAKDGGVPGTKYAGFTDCQIHIRGSYERLGEKVPRHFPQIIAGEHQPPITQGSGRLQLAEWIASPTHPLTARVMVNRIWQHHFGKGIVRTPGNFGKLGERPTNPQLLDYLADQFVRSGWSIKQMQRLIMRSATYQQASEPDPATLAADPENTLFGRMNVRRLEAEAIRDTMLAVSGKLDRTLGGRPVRDLASPRRTLYVTTIRSDKSGFWFLFDKADPDAIVDERTVSTAAPQALFMMNGDFMAGQVGGFVDRLMADKSLGNAGRIDKAYLTLYGRHPRAEEKQVGLRFLSSVKDARSAWEQYAEALLCTNELVYVE